jgi:SHS2 domain-containing protein
MYKLVEHTADIGIEAWADSAERVLLDMAQGMKALMFGDSQASAKLTTEIVLQAEESAELLVRWLNEIAYWCEKDNLVPAGFSVDLLSDTDLRATVSGEPFDPLRHSVERQVKSVTYHRACLEELAQGWHARVYVDL